MNNTYQIILNWDKGQPFSERMSAKILAIEGFEDIDPQSPMGGPDGTKDILAFKDGDSFVVGCYFPNGQKKFAEIQEKFDGDLKGVTKHNTDGFVFITNQKITTSERVTLTNRNSKKTQIYHVERVCSILDSPKGYGVRLEYLGILLTKEEQISYLNSHLNLKEQFIKIQNTLSQLNKVTTKLAGEIYLRDSQFNEPLSSLPISGVKFSSRLSIEDLFHIHRTIIQETQGKDFIKFLGFRKVEVWIGNPGKEKEKADFIPVPPSAILSETYKLLKWWREEYMKVLYGSENDKILIIAKFHEKFLTIHPFLDGNGRVARTLASIQYKDLLNKDVKFENIKRTDYYEALQTARAGDSQKLNDIFNALIKE